MKSHRQSVFIQYLYVWTCCHLWTHSFCANNSWHLKEHCFEELCVTDKTATVQVRHSNRSLKLSCTTKSSHIRVVTFIVCLITSLFSISRQSVILNCVVPCNMRAIQFVCKLLLIMQIFASHMHTSSNNFHSVWIYIKVTHMLLMNIKAIHQIRNISIQKHMNWVAQKGSRYFVVSKLLTGKR